MLKMHFQLGLRLRSYWGSSLDLLVSLTPLVFEKICCGDRSWFSFFFGCGKVMKNLCWKSGHSVSCHHMSGVAQRWKWYLSLTLSLVTEVRLTTHWVCWVRRCSLREARTHPWSSCSSSTGWECRPWARLSQPVARHAVTPPCLQVTTANNSNNNNNYYYYYIVSRN